MIQLFLWRRLFKRVRSLERRERLRVDELLGVSADQAETELELNELRDVVHAQRAELDELKRLPAVQAWLAEALRADELVADKAEVRA